jgi:hypothetical protein
MTMNKKIKQKQSLFRTSDLALASALSLCQPFIRLEAVSASRFNFIFEKTEDTDYLVDKYWNNDMRVDPREYFDAIRSIKARLYDR